MDVEATTQFIQTSNVILQKSKLLVVRFISQGHIAL